MAAERGAERALCFNRAAVLSRRVLGQEDVGALARAVGRGVVT